MSPPVSFSLLRFGFAVDTYAPGPPGGRVSRIASGGDSLSLGLQKTKKEGAYSPTRLSQTLEARVHGTTIPHKQEKESAPAPARAETRRRGER